ncbi:metal ABC transporter solute-binding protein, Zn/Mn family [Methylovirgula sp. HY1]|uniref:metal ABC transporter solute-binding protein, Zn/Mn family n=1 Tax=Methylovirgula sp. HY1 TaxID=2822761 RepID=UPI001C5AB2D1|nr:zinc ABC transporter substrate-binding protein [Methylovirgula sp. HY1]QXX75346.1 Manganese ABC transporter substrate-binding lipoprotein [Methylovirgula sp. HY1]
MSRYIVEFMARFSGVSHGRIGTKRLAVLIALTALLAAPGSALAAAPIAIVAAENFYGDVAQQIGGADVKVTSILNNPDQDPHLFEVSPSVARAASGAKIVIYSGIDYDPWMEKMLAAARSTMRKTIVVAKLIGKKTGDNPHIWYDLSAMQALAKTLAADLSGIDPAHRADYQSRLAKFLQSLQPIKTRIAALHARLAGVPVTATEPVFGYMLDALGLQSRNQKFQRAVMNNTEPSASAVAHFETDLKTHQVKMLVYNSQASDPIAGRMLKLAKESHVPVMGATETQPPGKSYQAWMTSELDAVDHALP